MLIYNKDAPLANKYYAKTKKSQKGRKNGLCPDERTSLRRLNTLDI